MSAHIICANSLNNHTYLKQLKWTPPHTKYVNICNYHKACFNNYIIMPSILKHLLLQTLVTNSSIYIVLFYYHLTRRSSYVMLFKIYNFIFTYIVKKVNLSQFLFFITFFSICCVQQLFNYFLLCSI